MVAWLVWQRLYRWWRGKAARIIERMNCPQRVIYESPDDATLIGRIEARHDGGERRVDYPMKRVACPGGTC